MTQYAEMSIYIYVVFSRNDCMDITFPLYEQSFSVATLLLFPPILRKSNEYDGGDLHVWQEGADLSVPPSKYSFNRRYLEVVDILSDAEESEEQMDEDNWFDDDVEFTYSALIFPCQLMHESTPVLRGKKYVYKTTVLYTRADDFWSHWRIPQFPSRVSISNNHETNQTVYSIRIDSHYKL